MINRAELTDEERQTLYDFLLLNQCIYVNSEEKCKRFLNAVLWILRSGDYCQLHWTNGIQCLNAFPDGASGVYGKVYTEVQPTS